MATVDQCRTTVFAVPVHDLPYGDGAGGDDVPVPEHRAGTKGKMVETTHLQLMQGEMKRFGATRTKRWWCVYQIEDTMVVTDQRVLFLWRRWLFGASLHSLEESFYLDDLQFVCLLRLIRWVWLWLSLMCIILGAILLAFGDLAKPKTSTYSYGSFSRDMETGDQGSYAALVAVGVILLLTGVACFIVFVLRHLGRGVYVSLNFCRKEIGIVDWRGGSWWRPRHSSTRRLIKLPRDKAQAGYNLLNAIIHDKFSLKVAHDV